MSYFINNIDIGLGKDEVIFALEEPDSPFVRSLEGMTTVLENL